MFAEIAPRYDFLNHLLSLNIDRYWRRRTLDLLDPKPGDPFLDVCTGTGDLALAVAKRLDQKNAGDRKRLLRRNASLRAAKAAQDAAWPISLGLSRS